MTPPRTPTIPTLNLWISLVLTGDPSLGWAAYPQVASLNRVTIRSWQGGNVVLVKSIRDMGGLVDTAVETRSFHG
jgi:hypothetical protein